MIVDCMTCPARTQKCDDCVVMVLTGPGSVERLAAPEELASDELAPSTDLQLDAAERRVVSMFVGAGLVKAGAAVRVRARRESVDSWVAVRDAG